MNKYFFDQTNVLHDEIVSLHEFILPTSTALWNFRKIIADELNQRPGMTVSELSHKYNTAPGTRGTTNLKIPFITHTWERQRERLAEVALIGVIALYEIWCEQLCNFFARDELAIKLQFPSNATQTNGVHFAITEMAINASSIITTSIYPCLVSSPKYDLQNIDNLLKCFRYFKELRNCLLHRGRKCDGKLYGAQSEFIPVATKQGLGMKFVPRHSVFTLEGGVDIELHGVLGFTEVILRIITTVDAQLSKTSQGEVALLQRIRASNTTPLLRRKLPRLFDSLGWKGVTVTPSLVQYLDANGILLH